MVPLTLYWTGRLKPFREQAVNRVMTPEQQLVALSSVLMRGMPPAVAEKLLSTARLRHCDRNATLFLQGEQADSIFIVLDGWIKLYRVTPNGSEAVVAVFTRGASFGEAVALQGGSYPVAAEAVTEATLVRIDAEIFRSTLKQSPETALAMLSATYMHLHSLVAQIEELKAHTGSQRVAAFLLELAPCKTGPCEVTLPYDKALIAGRLGLQPESLSRAFAKLKNHGVSIKINQATIEDVGRLQALIEEDRSANWAKD
jgi:CRP-like cAMP-binding protein